MMKKHKSPVGSPLLKALWAIAALSLGCGSLGGCSIYELQRARADLAINEEVPYAEDGNPRHRLDIFMPADARHVPVVFFVHGGYWNSQDKTYYREFTGLYSNIGIALARQGIGTVVVEYRVSPETDIEGELEDMTEALSWAQGHIGLYGGDPTRMVLAGHSAGGHLVAWLGFERQFISDTGVEAGWIRGVVPMSPVLDIKDMAATHDAEFNATTTYPVFGKKSADWTRYSPNTYFKAKMPPSLFAIGEKDYPYLLGQMAAARTRLQSLRAPASFLTLPGYRHEDLVLNFGKAGDPLMPAVVDFVRSVTK